MTQRNHDVIEFKRGDILSADAEAVVNTVNCVGIMGRGIALQFKKAYPENFKAYAAACKRGEVEPGRMFVFETGQVTNPRFIVNFPTKRHWKGKSRVEDIESGLEALAGEIVARRMASIALPPLGCGLGGLDWAEVRPMVESTLGRLNEVRVLVYEPGGSPSEDQMRKWTDVPKMTPGRAALVILIDRYRQGLLDPFVSLLEVHKLMYFLQEAGQPLRLQYQKGPYGPYAENLRHVLLAMEGYYISGYADGGDAPDKRLELVPTALDEARKALEKDAETQNRFERVSQLVEGFESSYGMELLATVHWVAAHEHTMSCEDVVNRVHAWSARKKQFTPRQIRLAADVLTQGGWLRRIKG
jgi:O-acetyl-ADP-ribose deacetylase (regulator of RNase III)